MLKFREGKLMIVNLITIIVLSMLSSTAASKYGTSTFYNIIAYLVVIVIIAAAILQFILARRLFKIAKQESVVSSKTDTEEDN